MLEIHETLNSCNEWDNNALFEAMDDLLESARIDFDGQNHFRDWPAGRVLCAECIVADGSDVVGLARIIWDSHVEDAVPQVAHVCVSPGYRNSFVIDSLETELIESYAMNPVGGERVRNLKGRDVDLAERARAHLSSMMGMADPRMI